MPRTAEEATTRIHLHVFSSDLEYVRAMFGGAGNIGQNAAMRMMIRSSVRGLREKAQAKARALQLEEAEATNGK